MRKFLCVLTSLTLILSLAACDGTDADSLIDSAVNFIIGSDKNTTNNMDPIQLLDEFRAADHPESIQSDSGALEAYITSSGAIGYFYRPSAGQKSETLWWRENQTPQGVTFGVSNADIDGENVVCVSTNVYPDVSESGFLSDLDRPHPLDTFHTADGTLICYADETALYRDGVMQWQEPFILSSGWFYSPQCNWLYDGVNCIVVPTSSQLDLFSDRVVQVFRCETSDAYALSIDIDGKLRLDGRCPYGNAGTIQRAYDAHLQDSLPAVTGAQFLENTILCQCEDGQTYALYANHFIDLFKQSYAEDAEYAPIGNKSVGYYVDMWHNAYLVRQDIDQSSASIWDFLDRCRDGEY